MTSPLVTVFQEVEGIKMSNNHVRLNATGVTLKDETFL